MFLWHYKTVKRTGIYRALTIKRRCIKWSTAEFRKQLVLSVCQSTSCQVWKTNRVNSRRAWDEIPFKIQVTETLSKQTSGYTIFSRSGNRTPAIKSSYVYKVKAKIKLWLSDGPRYMFFLSQLILIHTLKFFSPHIKDRRVQWNVKI